MIRRRIQFLGATAATIAIETEATMGDKSPKSKQRDQKQKNTAKATHAAAVKSKQNAKSHDSVAKPKGKK